MRAELRVREGTAVDLRRRAESVTGLGDGWDRVVVEAPEHVLAEEVLSHAGNVVAEVPESLREQVVARLRAVVGESA